MSCNCMKNLNSQIYFQNVSSPETILYILLYITYCEVNFLNVPTDMYFITVIKITKIINVCFKYGYMKLAYVE